MERKYGSATAQDLYTIFIGSGALDHPHWELEDNQDDDPVPDGWYVVVKIEDDNLEKFQRRLHADLLWVAILACASYKLSGVRHPLADKCNQIVQGTGADLVDFTAADADAVMQVALLGQIVHGRE